MFKRYFSLILILLIGLVALPASAIKYKGDLESNESITFPEQSSKPTSPAATKHKLYIKDDGAVYTLDSSGNENPLTVSGLKNKIINGNFDIWQRGTSLTPSSEPTYVSDRWLHSHNGSTYGSHTIARQDFTPGQTDVPGEPQYFMRWTMTTLGTDQTIADFLQRIERVRRFVGKTVTLSLWVRTSNGGTNNIRAFLIQDFGPAGSADVTIIGGNLTLTVDTWTKYTFSFVMPSITGKTVNDDNYAEVIIQNTIPANGVTFDVARVQIEDGSVVTDFEQRPPGLELALAQRYYEKTFALDTAPGQNLGRKGAMEAGLTKAGAAASVVIPSVPYMVRKRAVPTTIFYNPSAANSFARNESRANDATITVVGGTASASVITVQATGLADWVQGDTISVHWTADAEL